MPSPSAAPLRLAPEERARLEQMVRSPSTRQAIARRATIVLRAASGEANAAIARHLGVSRSAVSRWRARFLESGFRGLEDEPRTGAPRQIPADRLACVLRMALSGRSVNSTRAIALSTGVSQSTVCRVRRQFGIQPGMPGEGDPAVLALFGIHRVRVTGFFATPTGGVLAVDGGDPGGGVLVVCGGEPDIPARLPRPLLRPDGAGDPWTVLHQWLGFFADVRALCRDSRVTGNGSRLLARPA